MDRSLAFVMHATRCNDAATENTHTHKHMFDTHNNNNNNSHSRTQARTYSHSTMGIVKHHCDALNMLHAVFRRRSKRDSSSFVAGPLSAVSFQLEAMKSRPEKQTLQRILESPSASSTKQAAASKFSIDSDCAGVHGLWLAIEHLGLSSYATDEFWSECADPAALAMLDHNFRTRKVYTDLTKRDRTRRPWPPPSRACARSRALRPRAAGSPLGRLRLRGLSSGLPSLGPLALLVMAAAYTMLDVADRIVPSDFWKDPFPWHMRLSIQSTGVEADGGRRVPLCCVPDCSSPGLVPCPVCARRFCPGHMHFVNGEAEMCLECSGWLTQDVFVRGSSLWSWRLHSQLSAAPAASTVECLECALPAASECRICQNPLCGVHLVPCAWCHVPYCLNCCLLHMPRCNRRRRFFAIAHRRVAKAPMLFTEFDPLDITQIAGTGHLLRWWYQQEVAVWSSARRCPGLEIQLCRRRRSAFETASSSVGIKTSRVPSHVLLSLCLFLP